jgi:hypothetical protein
MSEISNCSMSEYMEAPAGGMDPYHVFDFIDFKLEKTKLSSQRNIAYFAQLALGFYPSHDRNHGLPHILNVLSHGKNLSRLHNRLDNDEITALQIAILTHDSVRYGCNKPAEESAKEVERLLSRNNRLKPCLIQRVTYAIASHSSPRTSWLNNDLITHTLYNADKSDLDRLRWMEEGINPHKYLPTPIEQIYTFYNQTVLETVSSHYPAKIVNQRLQEQEILKKAYEDSHPAGYFCK